MNIITPNKKVLKKGLLKISQSFNQSLSHYFIKLHYLKITREPTPKFRFKDASCLLQVSQNILRNYWVPNAPESTSVLVPLRGFKQN